MPILTHTQTQTHTHTHTDTDTHTHTHTHTHTNPPLPNTHTNTCKNLWFSKAEMPTPHSGVTWRVVSRDMSVFLGRTGAVGKGPVKQDQ
jgi:hypothetical protein